MIEVRKYSIIPGKRGGEMARMERNETINDLAYRLGKSMEWLSAIKNACILYLQQDVHKIEMSEAEIKRIAHIRDMAAEGLKNAGVSDVDAFKK